MNRFISKEDIFELSAKFIDEFRFACDNCGQCYAVCFEKSEFYYIHTIKSSQKGALK